MADIAGFSVPMPSFNITGFLSGTWIYIFIIGFVGLILVAIVAALLFFKTYNRRIVVFENISGQGYQPVLRTRARIVKLGVGGEELLKTLGGNKFVTAYGRKMGKNTYWFAKASDGYWYNIILGDLDTKMAMLDIEPVERDVRMFHVALDRLSHSTYGKTGFIEKYGVHLLLFAFLILLVGGMWVIVGKVGDSTQALSQTAETNRQVLEALKVVLQGADNIKSSSGGGLIPAG
jgi:hypothetical protein